MTKYIILIFILVATAFFIYFYIHLNYFESFNEQVGKFCLSCKDKTFNQCLECFNCGICVDKSGNISCMGGDHRGPYNFERCYRWYHRDPYKTKMDMNKNYKCSYGPSNASRVIGI